MKIRIKKHQLIFKRPAGTSRGILKTKDTWYVQLVNEQNAKSGMGEINMFRGLSIDDKPDFESVLQEVVSNPDFYIENLHDSLIDYPSIRFGLETALKDLHSETPYMLFENDFSKGTIGIPINGLIWMGDIGFMKSQIKQKISDGFRCLKMKIGALNFEEEFRVLSKIREEFNARELELRVDANGAFSCDEAINKLERLAKLELHSIEQPIKQGSWKDMADLCSQTPLPIALDEELIGVHSIELRKELLDQINPQYIILKPALVGGFRSSKEWIDLANERKIGWWITSALESNVGLNAIAQWTASLNTSAFQGLGTGQLYENNINSPLMIKGQELFYNLKTSWQNIEFDE